MREMIQQVLTNESILIFTCQIHWPLATTGMQWHFALWYYRHREITYMPHISPLIFPDKLLHCRRIHIIPHLRDLISFIPAANPTHLLTIRFSILLSPEPAAISSTTATSPLTITLLISVTVLPDKFGRSGL